MKDSISLFRIAEEKDIPVIPFQLPETGSLCVQTETGNCFIGIDENLLETESDKKIHLGHELGHCVTGSFYNRYATCDIRQKHENRANRWAIEKIIPENELDNAVVDGYTSIFELAEHFEVTEDFMRMAVCWYIYGSFDVNLYF